VNKETEMKPSDDGADESRPVYEEHKTGQPHKDNPETETVIPEISAYFLNPDISPSAFSRALKANKVKRFQSEDLQKTISAIENDNNGIRLWALMSYANLPEAVDRWIWPTVQEQLKSVIGSDFNPQNTDSNQILRDLCKALAPRLASKDKIEAKGAENWLRIGVCWLVEKRSIQLWTMAQVISTAFFADTKKAKSLVHRAISKGGIKELRLIVATVALGNDIVVRSEAALAEERRRNSSLRIKLTDADRKVESLSRDLAANRAELAQKEEAVRNVEIQLENERHHWGHDLSETKAGQRVLLGERVAPLLSDAIDALEIDPPAPNVALKRVKAVLSIIDKASS
jgi:hypothetical protein